MDTNPAADSPPADLRREARRYEPPRFEVISLDCEISAYAPDGDIPLL